MVADLPEYMECSHAIGHPVRGTLPSQFEIENRNEKYEDLLMKTKMIIWGESESESEIESESESESEGQSSSACGYQNTQASNPSYDLDGAYK